MPSINSSYINSQVPEFVKTDYPRLLELLKQYYAWYDRDDGPGYFETKDLRNNVTGLLSKYSSQYQKFGYNKSSADVQAELYIKNWRAPGYFINNFEKYFRLERFWDTLSTFDDQAFVTADGTIFEAPNVNPDVMTSLFRRYGFVRVPRGWWLHNADETLGIRFLKYMYAARGTEKVMKLFFRIYFGDDCRVEYPKFNLCNIDNNFIPDSLNVIRDDSTYQEYSYVIYVPRDINAYADMMDAIYMRYFHPGGFKVTLKQDKSLYSEG